MSAPQGHNSAPFGQQLDSETRETQEDPVKFLYAQIHVGDWISGTLGMTPELEGAYFRFLIRLYDRGRALPDDDRMLCSAMGLTIRVWRRLKAALVDLGKIIIRGGCLTNDRFEKERLKRAEMLRKQADAALKRHAEARARKQGLPEVSPKFGASLPEVSSKLGGNSAEKPNKINKTPVSGAGNPESYNQNPIVSKKEDSGSSRLSDSELMDLLTAAAGECLKNSAACPGLLVLSEPRRWLEQGCELHLDVLPVLRAVGAKRPLRSVGNWVYFTGAIVEARARRKTPLPEGDSEAAIEAKRIRRDKMIRSRAAALGVDRDTYRASLDAIEKGQK